MTKTSSGGSDPVLNGDHIKRVAIVFSGGPAPAANAVISAAANSFLNGGREVVGFFHGYSNLENYHPVTNRLLPDEHYRVFTERDVRGIRNSRGIIIGTARANPGKAIERVADLDDHDKTAKLRNVYNALVDLGIQGLISIGGDDTLKTANFLYEFQQRLPADAKRVHVVHLPKTIDNDYRGIDFTFGFFTAVDFMAKELQNLRADAIATSAYYIVETMGRKAGWLSYGVAVAGEANLVIAPEDVSHDLLVGAGASAEAAKDAKDGEDEGKKKKKKKKDEDADKGGVEDGTRQLSLEALTDRIVDLILTRERRGKHYGTVVLAEGLSELLPETYLDGLPRDEHGHISLGKMDLGKLIASLVSKRYKERTGQRKKLTGVQLGYESRCSPPHAFDVMLGSQLGVGAYCALVEEGLDGHMVSATGQLDLQYVPFAELVHPESLRTEVRFVEPGSDFFRLVRFLETRVDHISDWSPGRRVEN